jgi:hypothetical protein
MTKGLIFFCCACTILLFTIINISIGPIISGKVGAYDPINLRPDWGTLNCRQLQDNYDKAKKNGPIDDKEKKYYWDYTINRCNRKKGMYNMEYTSFIFDIVIGFICGLLGLLHHFELKKEFVSKTGLIGLGCGVIGFVLTFTYVILNGIVYTNYYDDTDTIYKRDGDGVFAEKKGDHFECLYYDFDEPENVYSLYAKYCDLINKQYNYDKDLIESYSSSPITGCKVDPSSCITNEGKIPATSYSNCNKLYDNNYYYKITNKDISDRFLTTLLLSLFVCLANIGLAIFGFLLFRTPSEF